jgi:hypothetical protein
MFTLLFSSEPFVELFRIPALIQHFQEHQERDERISFADFLAMHYWGDDLNDNDDEQDRTLPFKHDSILSVHQAQLTPADIQLPGPAVPPVVTLYAIYKVFHPDAQLEALFRPPKPALV